MTPQSNETDLTSVQAFIRQIVAEHGDPAFRLHFQVMDHIQSALQENITLCNPIESENKSKPVSSRTGVSNDTAVSPGRKVS